MRHYIIILIIVFVHSNFINAQNTYKWEDSGITINSTKKLQEYASSYGIKLWDSNLEVTISAITGLEGINLLAPSLDSYAAGFGYTTNRKAQDFQGSNTLNIVVLPAKKEGANILLALFANKDYSKHFVYEAKYSGGDRDEVYNILKSISLSNSIEKPSEEVVKVKPAESEVEEENVVNTSDEEPKLYNRTKTEKRTWELLKKYARDGYLIMKGYYDAPNEYSGITLGKDSDFTQWIDGKSEKAILSSISTVVHEVCHGYTSKLYLKAFKDKGQSISSFDYSAFYIENNQTKVVKHTDVFVTKKMNSIFPKELKTTRYKTYVYPSEPIMGSQQDGIYGLLDEFNAYYQGTKVSMEMFDYYKENKNTASGWLSYLSDFYGQYYSYLEFKAYILSYLIYAKKYKPQVYTKIINNKEFLFVLKRTDENWNQLIVDFKKKRSELFLLLKKNGHRVSEDSEFTFIGNNGIGNFKNVYIQLQKGLESVEYQNVAKIVGLISSNGNDI